MAECGHLVAVGLPTLFGVYLTTVYRRSLDFINLMTYDMNGAWNTWTAHNSPLYARSEETGLNKYLNMVRITLHHPLTH